MITTSLQDKQSYRDLIMATRLLLVWTLLIVVDTALGVNIYQSLQAALHHYDTLHVNHLNHSFTGHTPSNRYRHIDFTTLGRYFKLSLVVNRKLFSDQFRVFTVDSNDSTHHYHVNTEEYYHGYVHGDINSSVVAHVSSTGILTATIQTTSDLYHIEPSHHYITEPHPFHMVAYKSSHVRNRLGDAQMDFELSPPPSRGSAGSPNGADLKDEVKRQTGSLGGDSCPIILVADYTVFQMFKPVSSVISRLVNLVATIDTMVYRKTNWIFDEQSNDVNRGIGLEIRNVIVHTEPNMNDASHYNTVPSSGPRTASDLLQRFRFGNWRDYCLAHLFTNTRFPSGLLGLADIASPRRGETGGVCSQPFPDFSMGSPPRDIIYNTALTTFRSGTQQMVLSELIRVTGHEIGHSWGSPHDDPADSDCGNNWLMNSFAQDGSLQTHMEFSRCSRSAVGDVLRAKGACFRNRGPICGDYLVEGSEECDAGPQGDTCCTSSCQLIGAQCSDANSVCCIDCQYANSSVRCRSAPLFSPDCTADVFCDGSSKDCPSNSIPAPEGTPCVNGICLFNVASSRTECVSLCEANNKTSCSCARGSIGECFVCCNVSNVCTPEFVDGTMIPLSNGVACGDNNICVAGECVAERLNDAERLWQIIVNLDLSALLIFIRDNIVGVILILTIPLWSVGSCIIHFCVDRKMWRYCAGEKEHNDFANRFKYYYNRVNITRELREHLIRDKDKQPLLQPIEEDPEEGYAPEDRELMSSPVDSLPPPEYS